MPSKNAQPSENGMADSVGPYEERYVAFIDILGFSEVVRQSSRASDLAVELGVALTTMDQFVDSKRDIDERFRAQSFSDCTVMSEEPTAEGLRSLLTAISLLTLRLLRIGVLVRGGIAKGQIFHSAKAVFGPAFLEAHLLEGTIANYPRVVVDRATHADYLLYSGAIAGELGLKAKLTHSTDGPVYIDFLAQLLIDGWGGTLTPAMRRESYRIVIQRKLNESIYNPRHFAKLKWLAMYWNGTFLDKHKELIIKFPS